MTRFARSKARWLLSRFISLDSFLDVGKASQRSTTIPAVDLPPKGSWPVRQVCQPLPLRPHRGRGHRATDFYRHASGLAATWSTSLGREQFHSRSIWLVRAD